MVEKLKHMYLGHVIYWVREIDCTHDHKCLANCLDFIDLEAQISLTNLIPNSIYYLLTLFHNEQGQRIQKQRLGYSDWK